MLASFVLVAISLLLRSFESDAQLDDIEAPEVFDFDAVLKSVGPCQGADGDAYSYKMLNPVLERVSRDTVALSCDLEVTEDIPDDPSYSIETLIENVSETDESERTPIATFSWPDICGELERGENEGFRTFRESVAGDFLCPVSKGTYRVEKLLMNIENVKPLMREGIMVFTVKHVIQGKYFGCAVIEFTVTLE